MNSVIQNHGLEGTYVYIDDIVIGGRNQGELTSRMKAFEQVADQLNIKFNKDKCEYNVSVLDFLGHRIENGTIKPDPKRLTPLKEMPNPSCNRSLKRAIGLLSYYSSWIANFSSRISPLLNVKHFPMNQDATETFQALKDEISQACLAAIDDDAPFTIETDASDCALAAVLSQCGRPVAFFSRTLSHAERRHSIVEREAAAIVEAVRKWRDLLVGRKFSIVTDQQAVSYIFNTQLSSRIKNDKLLRWRLELSNYCYEIAYRPGSMNSSADTLSRSCASAQSQSLKDLHEALCHPGVRRMSHLIRLKNLPYSVEDVKRVCRECRVCGELKPRFFKPSPGRLVHARSPFERLSMDFVGPKPSVNKNKYLLVLIDEFSRFPFVYPCSDISARTVTSCLQNLFSMFGCPDSIHCDRGSQFTSSELRNFLFQNGVVITHSTPYHPIGNGQCERENGTIWRAIRLALKSEHLDESHWQSVLDRALHSIRSLLCTSTNVTPHDRFLGFPRRSNSGYSLPDWLLGGPAFIKNYHRTSKSDPLVEPVQIVSATPHFAKVRYSDGRESTVSTSDLAPQPPGDPQRTAEREVVPAVPTDAITEQVGESISIADEARDEREQLEVSADESPDRSLHGQTEDPLSFLPGATRRGRIVKRNPKYV